jgi:transposase
LSIERTEAIKGMMEAGGDTRQVADLFGVSLRTAQRWISDLRRSGSLPEPTEATVCEEAVRAAQRRVEASEERSAVRALTERIGRLEATQSLWEATSGVTEDMAPLRPREGHLDEAIPVLALSDIHWGETVKPEDVAGLNEYNPEIAEARLARYFRNALLLLNKERGAATIHQVLLWLGGDLIDNMIHPAPPTATTAGPPTRCGSRPATRTALRTCSTGSWPASWKTLTSPSRAERCSTCRWPTC